MHSLENDGSLLSFLIVFLIAFRENIDKNDQYTPARRLMSKDLTSSNERQRRSLTRSDVEAVLPDKTAASGEPKRREIPKASHPLRAKPRELTTDELTRGAEQKNERA